MDIPVLLYWANILVSPIVVMWCLGRRNISMGTKSLILFAPPLVIVIAPTNVSGGFWGAVIGLVVYFFNLMYWYDPLWFCEMSDHQKRILINIDSSLTKSYWDVDAISVALENIEANVGVVESPELVKKMESAISKLEECLHLMTEEEASSEAEAVCESLREDISSCLGNMER